MSHHRQVGRRRGVSRRCSATRVVTLLRALFSLLLLPGVSWAQTGGVANVQLRPFVIGIVPIVGNGAVGGVSVDAEGVLARAAVDATDRLRESRLKAMGQVPVELERSSALRKVSLRRLETEIAHRMKARRPLSEEIELLAGLQRVRYVFVYPQTGDIVLAGPAEGWQVDPAGNLVGRNSGRPPLELDDLLVALRTAEAAQQKPISCSIDPTSQGLARLRRFLRRRNLGMNTETLAAIEQSLGPQTITLTGVPPSSGFARTMVAADYLMKRLAMDFEPAPIDGLPSYIAMIVQTSARVPRDMMPRWWLTPDYDTVTKDADSLAWEFSGPGVRAVTEDSLLTTVGFTRGGRKNHLASQWAERFSQRYDELAAEMPVFADLQGLMDLAVVSALLVKEDLWTRAGYRPALLVDSKQIGAVGYHIPRTVDSRASFVRRSRDWVVGVSGGVQMDGYRVLEDVEESELPAAARRDAEPGDSLRWWWD